MNELPGDDKNRQHISLEQVKAAIDSGLITESVVLDTYASYEAMREERDELRRAVYAISDAAGICFIPLGDPTIGRVQRLADGMQAAEATVARLTALAANWREEVEDSLRHNYRDASRVIVDQMLASLANEIDAALSASPTGENSKK